MPNCTKLVAWVIRPTDQSCRGSEERGWRGNHTGAPQPGRKKSSNWASRVRGGSVLARMWAGRGEDATVGGGAGHLEVGLTGEGREGQGHQNFVLGGSRKAGPGRRGRVEDCEAMGEWGTQTVTSRSELLLWSTAFRAL